MTEQHTYRPTRWIVTPKGKNPAHVGASVIHPDGSIGKVVGGQSSVSFGGKAAACIGDPVECPGHSGVIIQGAKSISIGGKALAREGDKTSCGGVIMNGFPTITVLDSSKTVLGKGTEEHTREIKLSLFQSAQSEEKKYIGMPFKLKVDGTLVGEGISDDKGDFYIEVAENVKVFELLLENNDSYLISVVE